MDGPIAIVGSACRFPGAATSPSKLWELLKAPRDVIREFPAERLNLSNFYSPDGEYHGRTDVQNRAYLLQEDCRLFDASFFRINPKEAHGMDPQQRILLETVYESLEGAGCSLDELDGSSTSVHAVLGTLLGFVGALGEEYLENAMRVAESKGYHRALAALEPLLEERSWEQDTDTHGWLAYFRTQQEATWL